jgi:hypothetical protein
MSSIRLLDPLDPLDELDPLDPLVVWGAFVVELELEVELEPSLSVRCRWPVGGVELGALRQYLLARPCVLQVCCKCCKCSCLW